MMNEWIISSSILIAAVLLGRFLLRGKISLRLQYALWSVVLLRLLLPVQIFTSDFGTGSIAKEVDISAPVRQVYVSANEDRYEREYDEAYRQVVAEYEAANRDPIQVAPAVIEQAAQERAQQSLDLDLEQLLYHIWFGGMVVMASVIISCNVHLSIQLKRRRYALEVADSLLPVYITEAVPTPCIFGIYHPAIYLTPEAAKDPQVRAHVLEHELTHYRHWDHVWSVLRSLCLVLHWYNPLVWIAAKVSRADAELACDEGALARLGESQRGDYGRTLIGLTCSAPISDLLLTATTMTGSAGSIRERIKLLMKRPRNTVLTLTAVILLVTIIVGCTFSGAPETTPPTETTEPTETTDPTESTGHPPENDMSYQGQDLPIPEIIGSVLRDDGMIVFPGTEWNMSEAEVLESLHLQNYSGFSGMRGFFVPETTFWGYPVEMALYFDQVTKDTKWGLFGAIVKFGNEADFNAVRTMLLQQLGSPDYQDSGDSLELWCSDIRTEELVSAAAYEQFLQERTVSITENNIYADGSAVTVSCYGAGAANEYAIYFESWHTKALQIEAALPSDQTTEVRALFAEGGDPWYLAALAAPYADYHSFDAAAFFSAGQTAVALTDAEKAVITETYGKDALQHTVFRMTEERMDQVLEQYAGTMLWNVNLSEFVYCNETDSYLLVKEEVPELRRPEILYCNQLAENQVHMIYRFSGEEQRYCATLLKGETWKIYSNHLLLDKPLNARPLTEQETATVRLSFSPSYYDAAADESFTNPRAAFLLDMYGDISEMSRSEFLTYYPATEVCEDEAEFQLLKQKYPEDFENEQTIRDMNWPIHRIPASELKAVMAEYTLANWDDLPYDGWYHYLEETDCYYTYYSDVGLFGFHCTGGWVYDGGAMLYNNFSSPMSVLILTEHDGQYYIQAHLPALIAE